MEHYNLVKIKFEMKPHCMAILLKTPTIANDFAYNASLTALNIIKVFRKQTRIPFSIGQIKSLMVKAHFIKKFLA